MPGGLDEHTPDHRVPALVDAAPRPPAVRDVLGGHQPRPGLEGRGRLEAAEDARLHHEGERRERVDPQHQGQCVRGPPIN